MLWGFFLVWEFDWQNMGKHCSLVWQNVVVCTPDVQRLLNIWHSFWVLEVCLPGHRDWKALGLTPNSVIASSKLNFPRAESILPVKVICEWYHCFYLDPFSPLSSPIRQRSFRQLLFKANPPQVESAFSNFFTKLILMSYYYMLFISFINL